MGQKHAKANEIRNITYTQEQRRGVRIEQAYASPSWLALERQKRYAVARRQLRFLRIPELPVGNSAALALIGIERKWSDTIFDPAISSELPRFFWIFSEIFEPCARSWHGALAPAHRAILARFNCAADI